MTYLVIGRHGQLATALARLGGDRAVTCIGRPELDFDRPDSIAAAFATYAPSLVINAAAYTAVDAAEADAAAAFRANRDAPAVLAGLCRDAGVPLIHISTDYVFDGRKGAPYTEADPPCPTGVYGQSKYEGELVVRASGAQAVILRTSWVYAAQGRNFLRTMLNAARKNTTLKVVADQRGCPTSADDLADAVLAIAGQLVHGWQPQFGGVFHAAGTGDTTWYGFAQAIFAAAAPLGLTPPGVQPIATIDWPTPARRPADSRLDCGKLHAVFGVRLPAWSESLDRTVESIMRESLPASV